MADMSRDHHANDGGISPNLESLEVNNVGAIGDVARGRSRVTARNDLGARRERFSRDPVHLGDCGRRGQKGEKGWKGQAREVHPGTLGGNPPGSTPWCGP